MISYLPSCKIIIRNSIIITCQPAVRGIGFDGWITLQLGYSYCWEIPLNLPLSKGETIPLFDKEGRGEIL